MLKVSKQPIWQILLNYIYYIWYCCRFIEKNCNGFLVEMDLLSYLVEYEKYPDWCGIW